MEHVYLDTNATAPLASEVAAAMEPWWGPTPANPSAVHRHGQRARAAVEEARARIADLFADGAEVVFTSGGTEADNQALWASCGSPPSGHLVTTAIEHPAVLEPAAALADLGVEVTVVDVDRHGRVDPADVAAALRPDTRLVSVMAANNEVGTVQPIEGIVRHAHAAGAPVHVDAVQAVAWLDPREVLRDVDLLSLSAHKIGGPPGIGALVIQNELSLPAWVRGGGQQGGRRGGTEPTALIVGLAAACGRVVREREQQAKRVQRLAERLSSGLVATIPDAVLTTAGAETLPNTVHACFPGADAATLVARLDVDGLAVSAGSACASGVGHGSPVLTAMGLAPELSASAIRFSLGYHTTDDEIERALAIAGNAVAAVRAAFARS